MRRGPSINGKKIMIEKPIRNVNRTTGAMLSGLIAKKYGHEGLPKIRSPAGFKGPPARVSGPSASKASP